MQAAPAVAIDAGDGGLWRGVVAALAGLAAAVLLGWAMQWAAAWQPSLADGIGAGWVAGVVGGIVAAFVAWRRGRPAPARLVWNASEWLWQAQGRPPRAGRLRVVVDLGSWMLLRFDPLPGAAPAARWMPRGSGRARRWIPLAHAGGALRAALYAAPPSGGPDARARVVS
ncbi:MAG: hypothetical protein HYZ20_03995 [Burkholderiales bacterium]|nr:hypothetical protein [Burkholderiales bacterium]